MEALEVVVVLEEAEEAALVVVQVTVEGSVPGAAKCPPLSPSALCQSWEAIVTAYRDGSAKRFAIPDATAEPPVTPSAPPSTKSFWTSTARNARFTMTSTLLRASPARLDRKCLGRITRTRGLA